jgi:hypothetical protein
MNIKNNNVSIFSRLDSDLFVSDENVVRVKGAYYGKMLKFKLMGRSICRYNASLIVEQLKHNNGKYCNMMRKLIHSCIANGTERGFRANNLYIRSISVGPGTYLKRREFKGRYFRDSKFGLRIVRMPCSPTEVPRPRWRLVGWWLLSAFDLIMISSSPTPLRLICRRRFGASILGCYCPVIHGRRPGNR